MDFAKSVTKDNLMRAFAGESQARNRYTFAAAQAQKSGLQVISAVFAFTASQEKEHISMKSSIIICRNWQAAQSSLTEDILWTCLTM